MTRKNERVVWGVWYNGHPVLWFRLALWYKLLKLAVWLSWPVLKRAGHRFRWFVVGLTWKRSGFMLFHLELIWRYRELGCSNHEADDTCS